MSRNNPILRREDRLIGYEGYDKIRSYMSENFSLKYFWPFDHVIDLTREHLFDI